MLNQPYNLKYVFWLSCYFRFTFVPINCSFKSLLYISKKLAVIIYRQNDYWDIKFNIIYLKYCTSCCCCCAGLSLPNAAVLDISDIIRFLDYNKSSSISLLIKCKLRDLQKLLKYVNGTTTSASIYCCLISLY